jgi:beta-glucanase (GH16 family)
MNSQTMGFLSLKMRGDATFVACSLLFLCSSLVRAQHVIWSDEFVSGDQAIAPNPNVWTHLIGDGGGNGDLQEYTDSMENSYLQNGNLHIVIQKSVNNFGEASFTSARLESTVLVKYGTVTAKIKPPDVVEGLWPAFWTLGYDVDQVGWPRSGELNIMEIGQGKGLEEGKGNHRVVSGMHWENNGTYQASAGFWDNPVPLNDKYYAYTLDWTPTDVKTYINDVQIWRYDIDLDTCPDCEEFHKPHFLIFNQAVGGGFTTLGCGNSSGFGADCGPLRTPEEITAPIPATMFVDWVRIYDNGFTEITFPGEPELPIEPEPPCYIPEACANIDDCSHLVGECCVRILGANRVAFSMFTSH